MKRSITETPKRFLIADCGENGETKYTSILFSVNKRNGKVEDYFPPDHYDEFVKAVPVEIPEQYRIKNNVSSTE